MAKAAAATYRGVMSVDERADESAGDVVVDADEVFDSELVLDEGEPQVDPHYLELLRGSKLPQAYLPPAMAGPQKAWVRTSSVVLIAVFLLATTYGVCLTYGVGTHVFF